MHLEFVLLIYAFLRAHCLSQLEHGLIIVNVLLEVNANLHYVLLVYVHLHVHHLYLLINANAVSIVNVDLVFVLTMLVNHHVLSPMAWSTLILINVIAQIMLSVHQHFALIMFVYHLQILLVVTVALDIIVPQAYVLKIFANLNAQLLIQVLILMDANV